MARLQRGCGGAMMAVNPAPCSRTVMPNPPAPPTSPLHVQVYVFAYLTQHWANSYFQNGRAHETLDTFDGCDFCKKQVPLNNHSYLHHHQDTNTRFDQFLITALQNA